jgi:anti-sigma regulatory factor (Ser/Thr protein kinase)
VERVDRVETQLPSLASTPASARAFLREALQTWALDGLGEVVELLTGELVSNVVRHVDAPMTVRAVVGPSFVRVEVADPSSNPPVAPPADLLAQRGRGLMLVDALANRWGTELTTSGKTVWFEVDTGTAG